MAQVIDPNEAIEAAAQALRDGRDGDTLLTHAENLTRFGKVLDRPDVVLLRGNLIRRTGGWERASLIFAEAAERFPEVLPLAYDGALTALDANAYPRAKTLLLRLAGAMPSLSDRERQGLWRGASLCGLPEIALSAFANRADPDFANPRLADRFQAAIRNQAWCRALSVRLVSIGENCLPWMLGNRWGLRADPTSPDEDNLFNLAQCSSRSPAKIIADRAQSFLDPAHFGMRPMPTGSACPEHLPSGFLFNHELGSNWADDDFSALRARYAPRVAGLRRALDGGRRVFFHYAEYPGADLDALVRVVTEAAIGEDYRILIVDPKPGSDAPQPHPKLTYSRHPLPRPDYAWHHPDEYDADAGMDFERGMSAVVLAEMERVAG